MRYRGRASCSRGVSSTALPGRTPHDTTQLDRPRAAPRREPHNGCTRALTTRTRITATARKSVTGVTGSTRTDRPTRHTHTSMPQRRAQQSGSPHSARRPPPRCVKVAHATSETARYHQPPSYWYESGGTIEVVIGVAGCGPAGNTCSYSRPRLHPCQRRPTAADDSGSYSGHSREERGGVSQTRRSTNGTGGGNWWEGATAGMRAPGHGRRISVSTRPGEKSSDQSRVTMCEAEPLPKEASEPYGLKVLPRDGGGDTLYGEGARPSS